MLKSHEIRISMDGRGRALNDLCNIFVARLWRTVKYEDVDLKSYATMGELLLGLSHYFGFYNGERPHQALNDRTPDAVYRSGRDGEAIIVDKYLRAEPVSCGSLRSPQDTGAAPNIPTAVQKSGQRCSAAHHTECTT